MEYKAYLKNLRISQRKVQSVARLVRKLSVSEAIQVLDAVPRGASGPLKKLINSAAANAKSSQGVEKDILYIKDLRVDSGPAYKRYRPVARGRANLILKKTSHIRVVLDEKEDKTKTKASKKQTKKQRK